MFNKKQIRAIIITLKRAGESRPALQRVFEQGGYLWATDGYCALELGEVKEGMTGKCIKLDKLVGWYGTHTAKDTTTLVELAEDNELAEPDMVSLIHREYAEASNIAIDVRILDTAVKFLDINWVSFEQCKDNKGLYRVKPMEDMPVYSRASGIQAYIMSLNKK